MYAKICLFSFLGIIGIVFCQNVPNQNGINCRQRPPLNEAVTCCKRPQMKAEIQSLTDQCQRFANSGGGFRGRFGGRQNGPYSLNPCMIECIYNQTGIIQNGQLNVGNLQSNLQKLIDDQDFIAATVAGFQKCFPEVQSAIQNNRRPPSMMARAPVGCSGSPFARMLSACAMKETFINCPSSAWTNSVTCTSAKEFARNCFNRN